MITNPNTLGLFDAAHQEVNQIVHNCGALVYGDGANLNALLGVVRPADLGFDVMHFNLHKTFSTPHGGGGPGSGPVGVTEALAEFLPGPIVTMDDASREEDVPIFNLVMPEHSIGRVKSFWGNFGMLVRAYTYIRRARAGGPAPHRRARGAQRPITCRRGSEACIPSRTAAASACTSLWRRASSKARTCGRWTLPSG